MAPRARNPADYATAEQASLQRSFRALLLSLTNLPISTIWEAIRSGSVKPITESKIYQAALAKATEDVVETQTRLVERGLRSGLRDVPGTRLGPRVAELAERYGAPRAVRLIQAVDSKSRETIRALIKGASGRYATSPSLATLRGLTEEIKPLIGLTPKQAAQLRKQWRGLASAGVDRETIRATIEKRARRMIDLRAYHIGDRGVVESISWARHEAWLEADDAGEIPGALKQWHDQGDGKVRAGHRATSQVGPIPLREPYPIQDVQHPPSRDMGCRCYEELILP